MALGQGPTAPAVAVGIAMVLIGFWLLVTRRRAVSQLVGFLVIDNGIATAAFLMAGGVPLVVELGVTLDVILVVLILLVLTARMDVTHGRVDLHGLQELHDSMPALLTLPLLVPMLLAVAAGVRPGTPRKRQAAAPLAALAALVCGLWLAAAPTATSARQWAKLKGGAIRADARHRRRRGPDGARVSPCPPRATGGIRCWYAVGFMKSASPCSPTTSG